MNNLLVDDIPTRLQHVHGLYNAFLAFVIISLLIFNPLHILQGQ